MAQNYNLNSSFGFNITGGKTPQTVKKQQVEPEKKPVNFLDSVMNYVDENESVLNGDVQKEINMYSRQMMIVGMNLKASDKNIRRFDMNI